MLRGRIAHVLHVGDSGAYRLSRDHLTGLMSDHVRPGGGRSNVLTRALGVETEVQLEYSSQPVAQHDRFLLAAMACMATSRTNSSPRSSASVSLANIPRERWSRPRSMPAAPTICTALVLNVVDLETADTVDIGANIAQPPLTAVPQGGETIDGFVLKVQLSDGRYTVCSGRRTRSKAAR